jgi:2-amino-4-hydroxy-6-hydroxymethyldihydropteridine diphosphokinase
LKTVYLALGSNLGDRRAHLDRARELLRTADFVITRVSSIYETEPREIRDQPWFLNQAIEARTALFPRQLLRHTQQIERRMGRALTIPKGPRVIDVDILLYGEAIVNAADLRIPHPRIGERRFVLEPLAELAPELRHPVTKKTVREMLSAVAVQVVRRA